MYAPPTLEQLINVHNYVMCKINQQSIVQLTSSTLKLFLAASQQINLELQ